LILTLDASVALKWFFRDRDDESDAEAALTILRALSDGRVTLIQPPHFTAQMAAVLVREDAAGFDVNFANLLALDLRFASDDAIYVRAAELSAALNHYLFDTLYHAVALLTPDAVFVTTDDKYFRRAKSVGAIEPLSALKLNER
jgi:predicted nucleic acid-binding protein